jgi:hypothetical protein
MKAVLRWTVVRLAIALTLALGCSDDDEGPSTTPDTEEETSGAERPATDNQRCDTSGQNLEVSEYDTSGDDWADVRKVFKTVGEGRLARLVLVCREADLNGDGTKDVVRFYNDEGRPLREEADRNFDGTIDELTFFDRGRIVRQEIDSNYDGRVDTKVFYENGQPLRAERDIAGRSTASLWRPDTWEYYEEGRMVRTGLDVDGDGRVDRWDRDAEWMRRREAEAAAQREAEAAEDGDPEAQDAAAEEAEG